MEFLNGLTVLFMFIHTSNLLNSHILSGTFLLSLFDSTWKIWVNVIISLFLPSEVYFNFLSSAFRTFTLSFFNKLSSTRMGWELNNASHLDVHFPRAVRGWQVSILLSAVFIYESLARFVLRRLLVVDWTLNTGKISREVSVLPINQFFLFFFLYLFVMFCFCFLKSGVR